jgi:hypothetical protein
MSSLGILEGRFAEDLHYQDAERTRNRRFPQGTLDLTLKIITQT